MSEIFEKLRQELENRKTTGQFAKKFKFSKAGDTIIGQVTGIVQNPFKPESQQVEVRSLKDGVVYVLPSNVTLNRLLLESHDVSVGDYILARYLGESETPTKKGFYAKLYEAAVISKDDAKGLLGGDLPVAPPAVQAEKSKEPLLTASSNGPTEESGAKNSTPQAEVKDTPTQPKKKDPAKAAAFIKSVIDMYGKVPADTMMSLANDVQGFGLTLDEVVKLGGLTKSDSGELSIQ